MTLFSVVLYKMSTVWNSNSFYIIKVHIVLRKEGKEVK